MKKPVKRSQKQMTVTDVGILVENLAISTTKGFAQVHERIDTLENKVEILSSDMQLGFQKVRHDILNLHDTSATKEELKQLKLSIQ